LYKPVVARAAQSGFWGALRVRTSALRRVDVRLGEEGEGGVLALSEGKNLSVGGRLLVQELVARKGQNGKTARRIVAVQPWQLFVVHGGLWSSTRATK
jgi:predicted aconitase with swiveling domain